MLKVKKVIISFYAVILISFCLLGFILYSQISQTNFQFYVFDVGQGDAILIQTPNHYDILIDGGPDNTVIYKLGEYLPFYDHQIDLVVLTHPDADHLVGLVEVLRRYGVKAVLLTGIFDNTPAYQEFLKIIEDKKIRIIFAGQINDIGVEPNLDLQILYPFELIADKKFKEKNDSSIVAKLSYHDFSILLTGDAPENIEDKLIKTKVDITADILKIAHHGSSASSGNDFLTQVRPKLAVISVGENKFGHPTPEVLDRLSQQKIPYLTTIEKGDIIVYSNGQKFWLNQNP